MRLFLVLLCAVGLSASDTAPVINAAYVKQHFDSISDADMQLLRQQKILFASRSFGLNLRNGLASLAKRDARYDMLTGYQRWDVFKQGGDLSIIPADAFDQYRFVHFLATYWPHTKRLDEIDTLLRQGPHRFADSCDVVMVFFHTARGVFKKYVETIEALQRDYPQLKIVIVTSAYMGPSKAKDNANAQQHNEQIHARYGGRLPIYDVGAILSDDMRDGPFFVPEYSQDPADVHPNSDAGQVMMAKGFLLALRATLQHQGTASDLGAVTAAAAEAETLAADHEEYRAVRAILDANGLREKKVENVAVVEGGHVVELYLQEGGIVRIGDEIGDLRELRLLHCYGDRNLEHPFLRAVSPAIARCTKLREILFTDNDLETLPPAMTSLRPTKLSVAGNPLGKLDDAVKAWVAEHDPTALTPAK